MTDILKLPSEIQEQVYRPNEDEMYDGNGINFHNPNGGIEGVS